MEPHLTHAVVYGAKSTEDVHGSIPTQLHECRQLADRQGWEILDEFTDEAFSAYSGNRGPGLRVAEASAVKAAADQGSCVVVVQHTDRLARGAGDAPDAADHLGELFFRWRRQGVTIWSVEEGEIDTIRAVLSGERNTEDSRRKAGSVSRGMKRRMRRGLHSAGPEKYGYRVQRDKYGTPFKDQPLAVLSTEARVVERIITGIANGVSQKQMARDLNDASIPTKRGGQWSQSLISNMVNDPFYAGYIPVDGELVEGRHEAIVDMELLQRAQSMSARRRKQGDGQGGRPPKRPALFTNGHLRCGECGSAMGIRNKSRNHNGTVYRYAKYHCTGRERDVRSCSMKPLDADAIEQQMLHQLNKRQGQLAGRVKDAVAAMLADRDQTADELEVAEAELAKVDAAYQRIDDDYLSGALPADRYAALKDRLEGDRAGAQAEVDRLADRDRELAATLGRDDLTRIVARVMDGITSAVTDTASIEQRRNTIRSAWPTVVVHRDRDDVMLELPAVSNAFAQGVVAEAY
jgi:DNA invertase Pin-like site-specific DNA recombinase